MTNVSPISRSSFGLRGVRVEAARRLRYALVATVTGSGRAGAEASSSFGVSWWLVKRALDSATLTMPNVDASRHG
ncbi:hypothetical protein [Arthrobacter sp. MA-N2]|uniref:hypothetical protein n=1 Tax=Arthrobacter sp. MA-N2 TaxID=1101188 RepID=UPI0012DFB3EB|nr:hypothetical protein [Arthrobacter sp. MA-N2]